MLELTIVMFTSVFVLLGIMIYHSRQVDKRTKLQLQKSRIFNKQQVELQRKLHK